MSRYKRKEFRFDCKVCGTPVVTHNSRQSVCPTGECKEINRVESLAKRKAADKLYLATHRGSALNEDGSIKKEFLVRGTVGNHSISSQFE